MTTHKGYNYNLLRTVRCRARLYPDLPYHHLLLLLLLISLSERLYTYSVLRKHVFHLSSLATAPDFCRIPYLLYLSLSVHGSCANTNENQALTIVYRVVFIRCSQCNLSYSTGICTFRKWIYWSSSQLSK